jgi:hypothetical protein
MEAELQPTKYIAGQGKCPSLLTDKKKTYVACRECD